MSFSLKACRCGDGGSEKDAGSVIHLGSTGILEWTVEQRRGYLGGRIGDRRRAIGLATERTGCVVQRPCFVCVYEINRSNKRITNCQVVAVDFATSW